MGDVLAIAEHRDGQVLDVTYEVIGASVALANEGADLAFLGEDPDAFVEDVSVDGLDTIHTVETDADYNHDIYVQAIAQLIETTGARMVVGPNSVNGLDYLPALADAVGRPLITDAIRAERGNDSLQVTREAYGSKVETDLYVEGIESVLSIRAGEWESRRSPGDPNVVSTTADVDPTSVRSSVMGFEAVSGGEVDIAEADVLVSIGRGIKEEENLSLIKELGQVMDATISASRPIVDAGWLPKDRQVGQSGKTVAPDIYLAIGISGAVQHVAGIKGADTIIAVNSDPEAPIFDIADIGIVDDLFEVVPELIDNLEE